MRRRRGRTEEKSKEEESLIRGSDGCTPIKDSTKKILGKSVLLNRAT